MLKRTFIQLHWLPGIYWQSLSLMPAPGISAGAYPAWRAIQSHQAAVLKEE